MDNLPSLACGETLHLHIYRLDAIVGESWLINLMPPPYDSAKVVDIYPSLQFGQPVTIKKIEYWRGGVFWYGTRYLASGFGLIRWDIEPSDVWYLAGAIIDSVQWGTIVDVRETETPPGAFSLHQNHPNPFNPATNIIFELAEPRLTSLKIYNVLGQEVATLLNEEKAAGQHTVRFDASRLASGVYIYRLTAGVLSLRGS